MDDIRNQALSTGKEQALIANRVVRTEIDERVAEYYKQAEEDMRKGRWGSARLAVDKILLLSPEEDKALQLRETLRAKSTKRAA